MIKCNCLPLPWACALVVTRVFSPLLWRWVFYVCVFRSYPAGASLPELFFHPPPWFFQHNSAREQISGGDLSSVANLKDFLVLIRADVFQDHLGLTLGLILCECFTGTSISFSYSWVTRQLQGKTIFQAVWRTPVIPDAFSTWADRHCKAEQSSGRQLLQASILELSGLFSTLRIWEGLSSTGLISIGSTEELSNLTDSQPSTYSCMLSCLWGRSEVVVNLQMIDTKPGDAGIGGKPAM